MMYCFDRCDSMDQVKRSVQNELSILESNVVYVFSATLKKSIEWAHAATP